jgi:uncharacterized protein (TIGR02001 family)
LAPEFQPFKGIESMSNFRIAAAAGALLAAGVAHAGSYSVTPMIATDYDFRGTSLTDPVNQDGKPAFQLGGTYTFDTGIYVGAWGSTVDTSVPGLNDGDNIEVDFYGGYAWGDAANSFAYDVGINLYSYPGWSDGNTAEAYISASRSFYSAKLWYSPDVASSKNSGIYAELNANYPMGGSGMTLLGHVGQVFGDAYDERVDYSIGFGYYVDRLHFTVKLVDGTKSITSRVIGTISTTLPWSQ